MPKIDLTDAEIEIILKALPEIHTSNNRAYAITSIDPKPGSINLPNINNIHLIESLRLKLSKL